MRFQCSLCQGIVAVDDVDMGTEVHCGHCSEIVKVPASRLSEGAVVADFIILKELGRGGMGVVYLAHQLSLDRPAAVKILADSYANNAEFVVNFIKEARAAAKLNHPHIVQAYAVGEDEGIFYFAMENIDGETMKTALKRESIIPVDQAVVIIQQIAEALDYAWKEQKLIHRDIKPDNIMITVSGRAKLADLGLSKMAGEPDDADSDEIMGTPQYISPEHLTGAPMDCRSDIYSLGATFYHLITGKFPFEGENPTDIAKKHLEEPLTPPHMINPEISEAVSMVICKMMAKNVRNRYQDAQSLVDDLRMIRRGKFPSPSSTRMKKVPGGVTRHTLVLRGGHGTISTLNRTKSIGRMTGKITSSINGKLTASVNSGSVIMNNLELEGTSDFTTDFFVQDNTKRNYFRYYLAAIFLLTLIVFAAIFLSNEHKFKNINQNPITKNTNKSAVISYENAMREINSILLFRLRYSEDKKGFISKVDKLNKKQLSKDVLSSEEYAEMQAQYKRLSGIINKPISKN